MKRPPRKKKTSKSTAGAVTKGASPWIIREVSLTTYKQEDEISARSLEQSLRLLEKGVEPWNDYRVAHPSFKPYLRNTNLSWTNKHLPEDLTAEDAQGTV